MPNLFQLRLQEQQVSSKNNAIRFTRPKELTLTVLQERSTTPATFKYSYLLHSGISNRVFIGHAKVIVLDIQYV